MVQPDEDPDWQAKSKVASAYPDTRVYISWSANIAERNPALAALLSNIQLSADDVNAWSLAIIEGTDPAEAVKPWVAEHSSEISAWAAQ